MLLHLLNKSLSFFIIFFIYFLRLTFVSSAWSFGFFHPRHNGQWPTTAKDFYTRSYPLHYFLILILEKEPVFPFVLPPALDASTLPLGYQGSGKSLYKMTIHVRSYIYERMFNQISRNWTYTPHFIYGKRNQ